MAGLSYLDAIAAVILSLMIARIAWRLGWEAINELVDTGVDTGLESDRIAAVTHTIRSVGGVRDMHMLRTRRSGARALRHRRMSMYSWIPMSASPRLT